MTAIRSVVRGCGAYLPETRVTNDDLSRRMDTSDEWIVERTGIRERRIAAPGELTSHLAVHAARAALAQAEMAAAEIDLVVVATSTPDQTFPATATRVQAALGITAGAAFDVQAVCSGFVYALSVADALLRIGQHRRALVIGAETFSRILDWEDRTTAVLFGDGAGAVVLEAQPAGEGREARGIIGSKLAADGRYGDKLYVDGGVSSTQTVGHLRMAGKDVFRFAVGAIAGIIEQTLAENGYTPHEVDWFVPHQANARILDGAAKKVGIAADKIVITLDRHGNTSAASIPLALAEAVGDGRIQRGQLVLIEAMGGGFTWGASLIRW